MKTPIITQTQVNQNHINLAVARLGTPCQILAICNKAIEIALAEQATQEQFISADEARALGAGNAEYCFQLGDSSWTNWHPCFSDHRYIDSYGCKYRAIRKEVPAEPHADLKAMYEQQVKNGTTELYLWEASAPPNKWTDIDVPYWSLNLQYRCTPKPTCKVINLDTGELKTITREAAMKLQAETKDACDWFDPSNDNCEPFPLTFNASGIYTYRSKVKKQVSLEPTIREGVIALLQELNFIK